MEQETKTASGIASTPAKKPLVKKPLTEAELRQRLGEYVAPAGLYDRNKALPFVGRVSCNVDRLVAGCWNEIILDYEVGASGVADGAWFKVTFKFYSDWALFQTVDPAGANYVSAEYQAGPLVPGQSPATVQSLKVRFDQKGHERPFQKAVIVDTVDGYLNAGDHIIIRLGDRRSGGPGTRAQTFVEDKFRFRCYVDPLGTSRFVAVPGDVVIDIVPDAPHSMALTGPRLVRPGAPLALRVNAHDRWGNACVGQGRAEVTAERDGREVYRRTIELGGGEFGWMTGAVTGLPAEVGELAVSAQLLGARDVAPARHYISVDAAAPCDRVFYADLHVHSHDTVGTNSPDYNTAYGRDIAGLDVMTYTANDFQITDANWELGVKSMRTFNKDGRFVCYPVQEWCGSSTAGGDHNVVFLSGEPDFPFNARGEHNRTFVWNEDMKGTGVELGRWPIEDLWAAYIDDAENHLVMPHVGGRRYIPDWHHPKLERLIEISSAWGHFGWLYQDVIARGYKLGASASGDEHRGRPGGGLPGTQVFGTKGGITGVIADRLDRASIGIALRARHTFAATGERVVALASCGAHRQGDEFAHRGPATVAYRLLGTAGWDEIVACDHGGVIFRRDLQCEAGYSKRRVRVRWGGARIPDRYRWAEWRGTIAIVNGTINAFSGGGFEHPEESAWRAGPTEIAFRTDTYGDSDCVEIDIDNLERCRIRISGRIDSYVKVGNPLAGNPFVHCPTFDWEVSGAELLASQGRLRKELGGTELFIALERMSETPTPRDVAGTLQVDAINGPHGFRPIYFHGRQVDDAKVWTSAMFITFE